MAETDLWNKLDKLDDKIDALDRFSAKTEQRLDHVEANMTSMQETLSKMDAHLSKLDVKEAITSNQLKTYIAVGTGIAGVVGSVLSIVARFVIGN